MAVVPVIRIAAAHMKARSDAFRTSFISDHLAKNAPFPIREAIRATRLRPDSSAVIRLLMKRGDFRIHAPTIENTVGRAIEAEFVPIVNSSEFVISVVFPQPFKATAKYTKTELSFVMDTPLPVVFVTQPQIAEANLIPDEAQLSKVIIGEDGITYSFSNTKPAGNDFVLLADFGRQDGVALRQLRDSHLNLLFAAWDAGIDGIRIVDGGVCPNMNCDDNRPWKPLNYQTAHCTCTGTKDDPKGNNCYRFDCTGESGKKFTTTQTAGNVTRAGQMAESEAATS
jgi:hypothetical protein